MQSLRHQEQEYYTIQDIGFSISLSKLCPSIRLSYNTVVRFMVSPFIHLSSNGDRQILCRCYEKRAWGRGGGQRGSERGHVSLTLHLSPCRRLCAPHGQRREGQHNRYDKTLAETLSLQQASFKMEDIKLLLFHFSFPFEGREISSLSNSGTGLWNCADRRDPRWIFIKL